MPNSLSSTSVLASCGQRQTCEWRIWLAGPLLLTGDASQKKIGLAFRLHSGRTLYNPIYVGYFLFFFNVFFYFCWTAQQISCALRSQNSVPVFSSDFCIRKCLVMFAVWSVCSLPPSAPSQKKNGHGSSHKNKSNEVVCGYTFTLEMFLMSQVAESYLMLVITRMFSFKG